MIAIGGGERVEAEREATPLMRLARLEGDLHLALWAKRDDLFAASGGGNKARKMAPILAEAERHGCDALVTTGGVQSNHARAAALEAARRGWACVLVLHGDAGGLARPQGNLLLSRLTGAEVRIVSPAAIATGIEMAMQQLRDQGRRPWMIPGGGHCLAGSLAYVDAAAELAEQCRRRSWWPDCVIVASGTGTTQAGIIAGFQRLGMFPRVIGVSIARRRDLAEEIVRAAYQEACVELGISPWRGVVEVRDEWMGDGYERPTEAGLAAIRMAAAREGLILDPTYTGKAFAALLELAARGEFREARNVLFWHTGGLLNLLASPCLATVPGESPDSGGAMTAAGEAPAVRPAPFSFPSDPQTGDADASASLGRGPTYATGRRSEW
jgi:1-aminocyclopropane-1-carboxylate deaminase/D-cysteine desulfhydrase-like pyridoxal-dependent ACC family enzyme